MSSEVLITEDYKRMSEAAARILIPKMRAATIDEKRWFNLGEATGNSKIGLDRRITEKQREFDATKVRCWNLDEYVGLPGTTPSERVLHPESYAFFMVHHLFGNLSPSFAETHVPLGTEIEQKRLEDAIRTNQQYVKFDGADKGKALVISPDCHDPYLSWIRDQLLVQYVESIASAGGIDYWIVGVGGRGHIAFHESGIPLSYKILLVKLDNNTVENAVADNHFKSKEESPWYAISMGAGGVDEYARNILVLASGSRKTSPVAESLLGPETADVPISILQRRIGREDKHAIYILDEVAAQGIIGKEKQLAEKGITVRDLRV